MAAVQSQGLGESGCSKSLRVLGVWGSGVLPAFAGTKPLVTLRDTWEVLRLLEKSWGA